MHINTQPKSLREVADGAWIPDAVERVVLRALAKRPAQRFQSAGQLRQALEQAVVVDYGHTGAGETARVPGADVGRFALPLPCDHRGGRDDAAGAITCGRGERRPRITPPSPAPPRPAPPRDGEKQAAPETGRPSPAPAKHRSVKHARSTSKRGAARSR